jgi:hypothetical protein
MDWQFWLTAVCVVLAATYLARRSWRTWSKSSKGCTGCGCAGKGAPAGTTGVPLISADDLTGRLRSRR